MDYLARERVQELYGLEYSEESVAVVALLHDLCKVGCYKKSFRNVKNDATGQWERVPTFTFDDPLPYGHGEKSVYIANGFIRLTREEAMAIRWHMGFSGPEDARTVGAGVSKNIRSPSPWPQRIWRRLISWKMKKTRKKPRSALCAPGFRIKPPVLGKTGAYKSFDRKAVFGVQVRELMNPAVVTVEPSSSAALAAWLISRHNVGALPVCGGDGRLRGIVTDRDIVLRCVAAEEDPAQVPVRDIMTRNCATVSRG